MSLEFALKGLITEVLTEAGVLKAAATQEDGAAPAPRGRGRPPKGEASSAATPAPNTAATAPAATGDPFATTTPAAPTATIDQVRAALTDLKNATTQENALKVLKDAGGADNLPSLKPEKYGAVVEAAKKARPQTQTTAASDDPFGENQAAEQVPTIEEIKALIVSAQARTSADTVQKIVMKHGGKAPKDGGGEGPSLKALPISAYAAVVKELKGLPSTK